jgi:dTDP-4-dehydrorhamnose reductase
MAARRLLVTGGSGYLGRELVRRALAAGWEVTATSLSRRVPGGAEAVRLDVRDPTAVRAVLRGALPHAVVHTAYRQDGADAHAVTADGAAHVAEAARAVGARLVHLSTDLVFDGRRGGYDEDDPPRPALAYGQAKAEAERRVAAFDPDAVLVRTSLLYGGEEPGPAERLAIDAAGGRADVAFYRNERRSPAHVGDLAAALLELAGRPVAGPLHLAGAHDVSRLELARLIAAAHGLDPSRLRSSDAPPGRPLDCSLRSRRAAAVLTSPLRGVRDVLAAARHRAPT